MSLTCQNEELQQTYFLEDYSKKAVVEAELRLPNGAPVVESVVGGEVVLDSLNVEFNGPESLVVKGRLFPRLIYLAQKEPIEFRENRQNEDDFADSSEVRNRVTREYGVSWVEEPELSLVEELNIEGLQPEMAVWVDAVPLKIDYEILNNNTVKLNAEINLIAKSNLKQAKQVVTDMVNASEKINLIKDNINILECFEMQRTEIPIQGQLILPNHKPGIARVIEGIAKATRVTWEYNRGRILVKGFIELDVVYIGIDEDGYPMEVYSHQWDRESGVPQPFEVYFECGGIDQNSLVVLPEIVFGQIWVDKTGPRELYYHGQLICKAKIGRFAQKELVLEALPEAEQILDIKKNLLEVNEFLGETGGEIGFEQILELNPQMDDFERVLSGQGRVVRVEAKANADKVLVETGIDLRTIYVADTSEGPILKEAVWKSYDLQQGLIISGIIDFADLPEQASLKAEVILEDLKVELEGMRTIKVSGIIKVRVLADIWRKIPIIEDCALVTPVNPETSPSMLFYVVQSEDTLWQIARRYQLTMNSIARANDLTTEEALKTGEKLLIPKGI